MNKRPAVASRASTMRLAHFISDTGECGETFAARRVFLAYRFSETNSYYDVRHLLRNPSILTVLKNASSESKHERTKS